MAITRSQQAKQMLQDGGMLVKPGFGGTRQGYRGPGGYQSGESDPETGAGVGASFNDAVDTGDFGTQAENVQQNIAASLGGSGKSDPVQSVKTLQRFLNKRPTVKPLPPLGPFSIATNLFNRQFQKFADFSAKKNRDFFEKVIGAGRLKLGGKTIDLETVGQMTDEELEDTYRDYLSARANNEIDAFGNPINTGNGEGSSILLPQGIESVLPKEEEKIEETFTPNFRLLAGGGMAERAPYEGGIMDLESARQMYGLGKLVKKVTRTVKKIAKSPIGKAAILGAGAYFGLGKLKAAENLTMLQRLGIAGAVAGLPFLSQQEEEEEPLYAGADIADPRFIMANPQRFQNIRLMAEGGSTEKEPVAKKTMPLLDMGGQEMDLRAEGGFVPIGRMEKADDVPARLSKNEFVFTADAVRNAGDGDVDKGAEVMYNMMKNLEAGGDVSEESQGLEGARKMFQTSQRLEEVL